MSSLSAFLEGKSADLTCFNMEEPQRTEEIEIDFEIGISSTANSTRYQWNLSELHRSNSLCGSMVSTLKVKYSKCMLEIIDTDHL